MPYVHPLTRRLKHSACLQVQEQLPAGMGRDWGMMGNLFGQGGDNLTSDVPPPAEPPTKATFDLDSEPSSSSMTATGSGMDGKGRSTGLQQPLMSEAARIATTLPTWRQQVGHCSAHMAPAGNLL